MFMDDSLKHQSVPAESKPMENQLNMFTMEHEEQYGEMMNELINIFIPPENATREELEEAKKNMDKYADYRTYLSFDMQQIVQGEKGHDHRTQQDDQEKLRRRGAESFVCGTARQFRPGISGSTCRPRYIGDRLPFGWWCWTRHFQRWMRRKWQAAFR